VIQLIQGTLALQDSSTELPAAFKTGACGFGQLSLSDWPGRSIASLGPQNPIKLRSSISGCGACVEIKCDGAVRPHPPLTSSNLC